MADDLKITTVNTEHVHGHTLVGFSDGSLIMLRDDQYNAIHESGMQFAANIIKAVR